MQKPHAQRQDTSGGHPEGGLTAGVSCCLCALLARAWPVGHKDFGGGVLSRTSLSSTLMPTPFCVLLVWCRERPFAGGQPGVEQNVPEHNAANIHGDRGDFHTETILQEALLTRGHGASGHHPLTAPRFPPVATRGLWGVLFLKRPPVSVSPDQDPSASSSESPLY